MRRSRIVAVLVGVLLAGLLGGAPAEAKSRLHHNCRHTTCLAVSTDPRGRGERLLSVDIRKPRQSRSHARAWSYRKPGGHAHTSKRVRVTNNRGVAVAAWYGVDKRVPNGTWVCGKLGRTKVCTKI